MNQTTASTEQPHGWVFRSLVICWILSGLAYLLLGPKIDSFGSFILAGLWLAGLGIILRDEVVSLFGPVLAYDVMRASRKNRIFWNRCIFAALMGFLFTWLFLNWRVDTNRSQISTGANQLSRLSETFFMMYMVIQFVAICLLTPGTIANCITDEKERRTIEFMLATDLRDREILFGKFASRVGGLLMFLLAGLPILTMTQFFGGVDPDEVMLGFTASLFWALSLAAVALAASVLSRKSRDAIALTYLVGMTYCILSLLLILYAEGIKRTYGPAFIYGTTNIFWDDIAYPFACGNPLYMIPHLLDRRAATSSGELYRGASHFCLFHSVVIVLLITWAGRNLRSIALKQTFGGPETSLFRRIFGEKPKARISETAPHVTPSEKVNTAPPPEPSQHPDIGNSPILWKEVFIESGFNMGIVAKVITMFLVIASFSPVIYIITNAILDWLLVGSQSLGTLLDLHKDSNIYVRVLTCIISMLIFLATAIRGAGTIIGERDRHSLDVLLTTPLSSTHILGGKWLGCLLGLRWGYAWLFTIWLFGLMSNGLHPVMFIGLVGSTLLYASGFAWVGIFCSVSMSNSLRATMVAILLSFLLGGGYILLFMFCCVLPCTLGNGLTRDVDVLVDLLICFSPVVNMAWLPINDFSNRDIYLVSRDVPFFLFWFLSLIAWFIFNAWLRSVCHYRFRLMINRDAEQLSFARDRTKQFVKSDTTRTEENPD